MAPLFLLFELSILLSAWLNRLSPPGSLWSADDEDDAVAAPGPDADLAHRDES
jgi:hypothetical protein